MRRRRFRCTKSDGGSETGGGDGDFVEHFDGLVEAWHGSDFGVAALWVPLRLTRTSSILRDESNETHLENNSHRTSTGRSIDQTNHGNLELAGEAFGVDRLARDGAVCVASADREVCNRIEKNEVSSR